MGAESWQTAVQHIITATADTQILDGCELVGKCPHDKVREDALVTLWQTTSGWVALTGSEYIAQGRKVPEWHLMKMLHEMACMPGLPSHCIHLVNQYRHFLHQTETYSQTVARMHMSTAFHNIPCMSC